MLAKLFRRNVAPASPDLDDPTARAFEEHRRSVEQLLEQADRTATAFQQQAGKQPELAPVRVVSRGR